MKAIDIINECNKSVSPLKDPFEKDCVTSISMRYWKGSFSDDWYFTGTVEFINGNTKGEQKFDCSSPDQLHAEINEFLKTL